MTKKQILLILAFFVLLFGWGARGVVASASTHTVRVVFVHESKRYTYTPNTNLIDKTELSKRGFFLSQQERAVLLKNICSIGFSEEEAVRYVLFGIENTLQKIEQDINCQPVDSLVTFHPDSKTLFSFSAERDGFFLNREKLYKILFQKLCGSSQLLIDVPVEVIKPEYTRAFWAKNVVEIASFTTSYASSSADRKHNVALGLRFYNGLVVQSGEKVSFNGLVGARTEARGFRNAKIIVGGIYEEGVGGGVCQSSTTLYNALIIAGLNVTKRSPHSLTSSYISPGFDAMVSMGGGDLEFENNTPLPVYFKTTANANGVTVKIYGMKPEYKIVRRKVVTQTFAPPPDKIVFDTEGKYIDKVYYNDEWFMQQPSKQGMVVDAYLDYYKNGTLVKTQKLHTDKYKTVQGICVYGVHQRPLPPPEPVTEEIFPQY